MSSLPETPATEATHALGDGCAYHGSWDEILWSNIASIAEIAEGLEVRPQTVARWTERREATHFPEALHSYPNMKLYHWQEVLAWHEVWKRTRR